MTFNFADMIEAVEALTPPDRVALAHGEQVIDWATLRRRSNNLARALIARGLEPGDRFAFYCHNCADYLVALVACWKARGAHVNVNYRYVAEELAYILDDSDATVLVYGASLRHCVEEVVERAAKVRTWVEIGDADDVPAWAEAFDRLAEEGDGSALGNVRSPDDRFFIYTGGTTGMPKGVVWTHEGLNSVALWALEQAGMPVPASAQEWAEMSAANPDYPKVVCGPPLMHGTGLLTSYGALLAGGFVATLPSLHFEAAELLDAVDRWQANRVVVVGDAFARPILDALDAEPDRWDVSHVRILTSSGVMWSQAVKDGLIRHMPEATCQDNFSSSEAIGMGTSLTTKDGTVETAKFALGGRCRVLDDDDRDVAPGSDVTGKVVLAPPTPLHYHKDPEKSARTFREIDGVRYTVSGDFAKVNADGSIVLLGRGSACINSAGEKIFPEEVEEALKVCGGVADALVFGTPDPKWGQAVTAVVQTQPGFDEASVRAELRRHLAGYKLPKALIATDQSLRAPNGKADYNKAKALAAA